MATNTSTLATLLELLKSRLDITWVDDSTDAKLKQFIEDGVSAFATLTGESDFDYTVPSTQRELLFTRCQYALENMLDDFSKNYQSEIVSMINRAKVKRYVNEKANSDTSV